MKNSIVIDNRKYFETTLGYSHAEQTVRFTVYATDPHDVDSMINRLVEFRAEKIAEERRKTVEFIQKYRTSDKTLDEILEAALETPS